MPVKSLPPSLAAGLVADAHGWLRVKTAYGCTESEAIKLKLWSRKLALEALRETHIKRFIKGS
jgi:hypothetical protein